MALWSGWLAAIAIVARGGDPARDAPASRQARAPTSKPIRAHVVLGLVTSAFAFGHTILVIPALGSPAATGAGPLAIAPAGLAFFLLVAHAGLGLQLRDEKLKTRAKTRRSHAMTAVAIVVAVGIHILTLEQARR